jgi:integrase
VASFTCHTFATINLMAGINPNYIASQLGHTTTAMLFQRYAKWIPGADDRRAAAQMNAAFGGPLPVDPQAATAVS